MTPSRENWLSLAIAAAFPAVVWILMTGLTLGKLGVYFVVLGVLVYVLTARRVTDKISVGLMAGGIIVVGGALFSYLIQFIQQV